MRSTCYCPLGMFYAHDQGVIAHRYYDTFGGVQDLPVMETLEEFCVHHGIRTWGKTYIAYWCTALSAFLVLLVWCMTRFVRLFLHGSRDLQKSIHVFCLIAIVFRIVYLLSEASLVYDSQPQNDHLLQKLASISYTAFFALSASAFLCVCLFWLRLVHMLDGTEERPGLRGRFLLVCYVILALEAFHDFWCLLDDEIEWLDAIYFIWLSLVDVAMSLFGFRIGNGLYQRMRAWVADESRRLFRKTQTSMAILSGTSVAFLGLSAVFALFGRFFAWPCLACWIFLRLMEVAYLVAILDAAGRSRRQVTLNRSSVEGTSFASSFTGSSAGQGTGITPVAAFWISSRVSAENVGRHPEWPPEDT